MWRGGKGSRKRKGEGGEIEWLQRRASRCFLIPAKADKHRALTVTDPARSLH